MINKKYYYEISLYLTCQELIIIKYLGSYRSCSEIKQLEERASFVTTDLPGVCKFRSCKFLQNYTEIA
jgi:hypothetical protein